jgi:hypothetical protein
MGNGPHINADNSLQHGNDNNDSRTLGTPDFAQAENYPTFILWDHFYRGEEQHQEKWNYKNGNV